MKEFTVSNDVIGKPEALRARAAEQGYLFFKKLIDPAHLRAVRADILGLCADAGWLKAGTDPIEGIAAPGVRHIEPEPGYMEVYLKVMRLESFHTLAHEPPLLHVLEDLFAEKPLPHPRNIARIIFPQATDFTTPAHQDYVHIQGTPETWTSWIPLGDCPQNQGSLAVLSGSHRNGIYPTRPAQGAGGLGIDTDALGLEWAASDFQAGDVLLFHSHCVHKGLPNATRDRIRVSVDYRYQGVSQPAVPASFEPHFGAESWEEIYSGWKSEQFQFYWKDHAIEFVEWTPKYHLAAQTT